MKYIITENKMEEMIIRYLDNAFGDLTEYKNNNRPDELTFAKDDIIYMVYYSDGVLFVDFNNVWDNVNEFFSWKLKNKDLVSSIKIWVKKQYDLDVDNVYETYIRQTMRNGVIN